MFSLIRSILRLWNTHGTIGLFRLVLVRVFLPKAFQSDLLNTSKVGFGNKSVTVKELSNQRFLGAAPLRFFTIPSTPLRRISIVTDSIGDNSLYGGVGTAIIFASLLAEKMGARLRLVTRTEGAKSSNLEHILETYEIQLAHEVEFAFAPCYDNKYEIDIFDDELFLTTSWWTTAATIASVRHSSVIYLLQEDERMFYPFGDERLRCEQILSSKNIHFVVNTRLLFEHLVSTGLQNVASQGMWFEPAFPDSVFFPRARPASQKRRRLMFYARPNNLRNLFFFGLELIEEAINRNIINLDEWDILFVGKNIPNVVFGGRYAPTKYENLRWSGYADLAGSVDLALSLMYTPHPSYPPLDLAASGAVVITNRFENKIDLSNYSKNILCCELEREAMLAALSDGIRLAEDTDQRNQNYRSSSYAKDWEICLRDVITTIARTR